MSVSHSVKLSDFLLLLSNYRLFDFDFLDFVIEGDDFVAVLEEHSVPRVDLSGLVEKYFFLFLQLHRPFVDGLLHLAIRHRGSGSCRRRRGSR